MRFTSLVRAATVTVVFGSALTADPPGAMLPVLLQVPAALNSGAFVQARVLNVPPGFQIALLAKVSGARFMAVAPNGDILVSQPDAGQITLLRPVAGGIPAMFTFATGLNQPQGLTFHQIGSTTYLYVSETQQVSRYVYSRGDTSAHDREIIVAGLPAGGNHPLKNIAIDANDKLYVAIGSSCNVCVEDTTSSPQRGAIYVYNADGSGGRLFARGLRNAEGLAVLPVSSARPNQLWVVVNGRDDIPYPFDDATGNFGKVITSYVDDHPPDLFTSVRDGGNYGWPFCNPNADVGLERDYDTNRDGHINCSVMDFANKGIPAHSAPLGLSLLQESAFAFPYRPGAAVAFHGSWDRSIPTGYKVVWYAMANPSGVTPNFALIGNGLDLVSGWLDDTTRQAWGRPVDAIPDSTGGLLISDDLAGAVYRLTYTPNVVSSASAYAVLAADSLGSIHGTNLAAQTASAPSPDWPLSLGGVSVQVQDSQGATRVARLGYVSTNQINFLVPTGTAVGDAHLTVLAASGPIDEGTVTIAAVAPSLFSADGIGAGPAAATAVRVNPITRGQTSVPVYSCPGGTLPCSLTPITLGSDEVYVSFFGTGLRGFSSSSDVKVMIGGTLAQVEYIGPQPTWPGLDQINVRLASNIAYEATVLDVVITVDGKTSNTVQIAVQ
jgi:uncharacterized protein (TIGR03437 family)